MSVTAKQKSEYTFKANRSLGRHGWLRLTPAYGVKLVEKLLISAKQDAIIVDPFFGTATTGLVAAEKGYRAVTFDINPFLIWLGKIKCQNYSEKYLADIQIQVQKALAEYKAIIGSISTLLEQKN
jgi:D12 class N6 adenine-specific DNA methyltransferase